MEKRAQIKIIVLLLIIVLVLVCVVIFWNLYNSLIKNSVNEVDVDLLNVDLEISDVIFFVDGSSKISVKRGVGLGEIDSIKILFYDEIGQNDVKEVFFDEFLELSQKTFFLDPPKDLGEIKKLSVVPVINNRLGLENFLDVKKVLNSPRDLVSWYRFSNNEDFLEKNDGVLVGSSIDSGVLVLNENGYFNCGDVFNFYSPDELGFMFWVYPENNKGILFQKGQENSKYSLNLNSDFGVDFFSYDSSFSLIKSFRGLKLNEWNHVAISIDWKGIKKLYINSFEASNFIDEEVLIKPYFGDFIIGKGIVGKMDEFMIFNRTLTKQNVNYVYNNFRPK